MSDQLYNSAEKNNSLPAVIPSAALLLRRTQTTLGLLHTVIQESSATHWFNLAKSANQAGERDMAVFAFKQCLKLDNMSWQEALHLAVMLGQLQQGEFVAQALLKSYETHCPDWYRFFNELSYAQWHMLKHELESTKKTIQSNFIITIALSLVHWMTNNHDYARLKLESLMFSYKKEIETSPLWHHLLGFFWHQECNYIEAISSFNNALDINAKYASAFFGRGVSKKGLASENAFMYSTIEERNAEMFSDFAIALELDKDYADVYYERGLINARPWIKKFEEAILDFSRVIELQPHYYEAYTRRSNAKGSLNDWTGAYEDLKLLNEVKTKGTFQI